MCFDALRILFVQQQTGRCLQVLDAEADVFSGSVRRRAGAFFSVLCKTGTRIAWRNDINEIRF